MSLTKAMSDKGAVWQDIVRRYKLVETDVSALALWSFGDFLFGSDWDLCSDITKLRQTGFVDIVDTESMIFSLFDQYRSEKVIA